MNYNSGHKCKDVESMSIKLRINFDWIDINTSPIVANSQLNSQVFPLYFIHKMH